MLRKITFRFDAVCTFAAVIGLASSSVADDWAQWRGPGHNNVAAEGNSVPTSWSEKKNVLWKTPVPGRGHSSPTVVGDLIVMTSADENNPTQAVIAFDRATGKQRWVVPVSRGGFPKTHTKNTHASSTVASADGMFFAAFHHHNKVEAVAVDSEGNVVWQVDVGNFRPVRYEYGYAASPTVYGDTLIVTGECDTATWMKALDLQTGKVRWEQERPITLNWASPIVATVGNREQLLLSGGQSLMSYDPKTGNPLWKAACLAQATCGTAVWHKDIVIAGGGYPEAGTAAVRADGSGKVLWTNNVRCYEQSLLAYDGYVYALDDRGIAHCWNAESGEETWKKRLGGEVSASPLLVGDTIYASNETGTTYVFRANPEKFESIGKNQLGDESFASPVVVDNVLYLRVAHRDDGRQEFLYAIGEK